MVNYWSLDMDPAIHILQKEIFKIFHKFYLKKHTNYKNKGSYNCFILLEKG